MSLCPKCKGPMLYSGFLLGGYCPACEPEKPEEAHQALLARERARRPPRMSVEKRAVRLADVYRRAEAAAFRAIAFDDPVPLHASQAAHEVALLLVQQALNEDILGEWLKPEEPHAD